MCYQLIRDWLYGSVDCWCHTIDQRTGGLPWYYCLNWCYHTIAYEAIAFTAASAFDHDCVKDFESLIQVHLRINAYRFILFCKLCLIHQFVLVMDLYSTLPFCSYIWYIFSELKYYT